MIRGPHDFHFGFGQRLALIQCEAIGDILDPFSDHTRNAAQDAAAF